MLQPGSSRGVYCRKKQVSKGETPREGSRAKPCEADVRVKVLHCGDYAIRLGESPSSNKLAGKAASAMQNGGFAPLLSSTFHTDRWVRMCACTNEQPRSSIAAKAKTTSDKRWLQYCPLRCRYSRVYVHAYLGWCTLGLRQREWDRMNAGWNI